MKFEYQTTVMHINENIRNKTIALVPPDGSWSLLNVAFNGEYALYTWAKQIIPQTIATFESSEKDFETSCKMVTEIDNQVALAALEEYSEKMEKTREKSTEDEQQNTSNSTTQK